MSPRKAALVAGEQSDIVAEMYDQHYDLLMFLAHRRYAVPATDAEALVHEVFVGLLAAREAIHEARAWLIGAICYASRAYWRSKRREKDFAEGLGWESRLRRFTPPEDTPTRLTVGKMLDALPNRQRESLRLRFFEGCTMREVALELGTTERYAEKLVAKAIRRAYEDWVVPEEAK